MCGGITTYVVTLIWQQIRSVLLSCYYCICMYVMYTLYISTKYQFASHLLSRAVASSWVSKVYSAIPCRVSVYIHSLEISAWARSTIIFCGLVLSACAAPDAWVEKLNEVLQNDHRKSSAYYAHSAKSHYILENREKWIGGYLTTYIHIHTHVSNTLTHHTHTRTHTHTHTYTLTHTHTWYYSVCTYVYICGDASRFLYLYCMYACMYRALHV